MTRTLFRGGAVFDGERLLPEGTEVEIEGERILRVGTAEVTGPETRIVDLDGATLVPGAIDAHVHLTMSNIDTMHRLQSPFTLHLFEAVRNAALTVAGGITTVRDAAGADAGLRQAIADGLILGPRTLLAINMISQTGGHNDGHLSCGVELPLFAEHPGVPAGIADGPDEMRRVARRMIRAGADQLKVATTGGVLSPSDDPRHPQFRSDELAALVAEAAAVDIPVMAHAQGGEGIEAAVRAGVRSIEHGIYLDRRLADLMVEHGTVLVPTLVAPLGVLDAADRGEVREAAVVEKARRVVDRHREAVGIAIDAGVRIALGTDAGIAPHGRNLREIELLVDCGLDPLAAWTAATATGAELVGRADILGRITPGRLADLVVIRGELSDVHGLPERVRETWIGGARRHDTREARAA